MTQTILMVDDDEGFLRAAAQLLRGAGYQVATASNADQARQALRTSAVDLVLLDVIMPAQDGLSFAQELAESGAAAGVPVILVTAMAESPGHTLYSFEKGLALTAADILPKSAVPEQLLDCVASVLGGKNAACKA